MYNEQIETVFVLVMHNHLPPTATKNRDGQGPVSLVLQIYRFSHTHTHTHRYSHLGTLLRDRYTQVVY